MEKLYRGEIISKERSGQMIELLKRCNDAEQIQAGLPANVPYAHKTGEAYALFHDGGIVYTDNGDYILVMFSDGVNYKAMMSEVSAYIYNFTMNAR